MDFPPSTAEQIGPLASATGFATTITHGSSFSITQPSGLLFDMRQFNSYYLTIDAVDPAVPTKYNMCQASIFFQDGPALGSNILLPDFYEWHVRQVGGGFTLPYGPAQIQDKVHGPYMWVNVTNPNPVDSLTINYTLTGTTRDIGQPYVRQIRTDTLQADGTLAAVFGATIGASGVTSVPCLLGYGNMKYIFMNSGAAGMNFLPNPGLGATNEKYPVVSGAAAATIVQPSIVTKRALRVDVAGTATQVFSCEVYTQYQKV